MRSLELWKRASIGTLQNLCDSSKLAPAKCLTRGPISAHSVSSLVLSLLLKAPPCKPQHTKYAPRAEAAAVHLRLLLKRCRTLDVDKYL